MLIIISLFSLLLWIVNWLTPSFAHFFNLIQGLPDQYTGREWYFIPSHFGLTARFVAVTLGLTVSLNILTKERLLPNIKRLVAAALFFEAGYWLSLLPSCLSLFTRSPAMTTLGLAYLMQAVLTIPFLLILAVKLVYHNYENQKANLWKWVGYAFAGYIGALWSNSVLRWVDMVWGEGVAFFANGVRSFGFFESVIFMSLAVAFAVAGAFALIEQDEYLARKWVGLALTMVGLHYVIYLIYSYIVNAVGFALLVDVWTAPFLGLGLSLLFVGDDAKLRLNVASSSKTIVR